MAWTQRADRQAEKVVTRGSRPNNQQEGGRLADNLNFFAGVPTMKAITGFIHFGHWRGGWSLPALIILAALIVVVALSLRSSNGKDA
jgi:hypothetical protein